MSASSGKPVRGTPSDKAKAEDGAVAAVQAVQRRTQPLGAAYHRKPSLDASDASAG